jgi:nucleotide-binding universal stress UspA family protein
MKSPILIAYDFGPASEAALAWSAKMSLALGAPLVVVHVLVPTSADIVPALLLSGYPTQVDVAATRASLTAAAVRYGVTATSEVAVHPNVGGALIERARHLGAGLIVMGTHGHGALVRAMLGSAATYAIQHADCPVVVMRDTSAQQQMVHEGRRSQQDASGEESFEARDG